MHLAASSGDKSLSMASNFGGLGRLGRRKYGGVEGAVGEFSLLLFPPFCTVERWMTAPRATGDKYMMAITNLDGDYVQCRCRCRFVDVDGMAMASTELW